MEEFNMLPRVTNLNLIYQSFYHWFSLAEMHYHILFKESVWMRILTTMMMAEMTMR